MYMADTLSRAYLRHNKVPSTDQEQVMTVTQDDRFPTEKEVEHINMCQFLPVTDETLAKIQAYTRQDQQLQILTQVILQGWPDSIKKGKEDVHDYYPFRETLSVQNGIIFKGERVIIPYGLREEMKSKLHASHLGIQGCLRRAREAFYWPRMNTEVEEYISKCSICNTFPTEQQKEPLMSHPVPSRPWESIATDLFELNGRHYLAATDYFSNFCEVDRLYSTMSREVINKLKSHISRLMSDNGPQFSSEEFKKFAADYQFQHITSSPNYPQSNGKAENAVKNCEEHHEQSSRVGNRSIPCITRFSQHANRRHRHVTSTALVRSKNKDPTANTHQAFRTIRSPKCNRQTQKEQEQARALLQPRNWYHSNQATVTH